MKKFLIPALAALSACATEPQIPDISGAWSFTAEIANDSIGWSCEGGGTFNISQAGTTFAGTYALKYAGCTTPSGTIPLSLVFGSLSQGTLSGRAVTFADNKACNYEGEVHGNPAEEMSGNIACPIVTTGAIVPFTGTWRATR